MERTDYIEADSCFFPDLCQSTASNFTTLISTAAILFRLEHEYRDELDHYMSNFIFDNKMYSIKKTCSEHKLSSHWG